MSHIFLEQKLTNWSLDTKESMENLGQQKEDDGQLRQIHEAQVLLHVRETKDNQQHGECVNDCKASNVPFMHTLSRFSEEVPKVTKIHIFFHYLKMEAESTSKKLKVAPAKARKRQTFSDPIFYQRVADALKSGKECFEDEDYGHVCAQRMWEDGASQED